MDAAETPDGPETAAHDGGRPAWQRRLLAQLVRWLPVESQL